MYMRKMGLFFALLIFEFVYLNPSLAQEIPILKDVQVRSEVTFDGVAGRYHYFYRLTNPPGNTGQISIFDIEIVQPPGGKEFSPEGHVIELGENFDGEKVTSSFIEELSPLLEKPVVPVGADVPKGWGAGISVYGTLLWGSNEKTYRIMPGHSLKGFEAVSEGLPGIRSFEVKPAFTLVVEGFVTKEDIEKSMAIKEQIKFRGKTIGPTAPPANFVLLDFLNYLIDLKHQAQALGWIGGLKLVEELDKKLDQVKEKLLAGNTESAQGKLKSFIEKVEVHYKETKEHEIEKIKEKKEDKKFVTSEGYALLKFNAEYLREQIGKLKEREDKEEHEEKEGGDKGPKR